MYLRFLTFSLIKSGLWRKIFQWLIMVIKIHTFRSKHAEIPSPSLCPFMLQRFNSYEIPLKIFVGSGFGGVIHIRENLTKVAMLVNHERVPQWG